MPFPIFFFLEKGAAIKCKQCGDDGVCKEGVEETVVTCTNDSHVCQLMSSRVEVNPVITKSCFQSGPYKYVGCIRETAAEPGGVRHRIDIHTLVF